MDYTIKPLKGLKSLKVFNVFHRVMLGLNMLPAYINEPYEKFYDRIGSLSEDEQSKLIKEALVFVDLEPEEVECVVCFCEDKNGVPFGKENLRNLKPDEILEMIRGVLVQIAKIKISLLSEDEKKKPLTLQ